MDNPDPGLEAPHDTSMPSFDTPLANRREAWEAAAFLLDDESPLAGAYALAKQQGLVLAPEQARAAGVTDGRMRSLVRRREWSRPRRNVLCVLPPDPDGMGAAIAASAAQLCRPGTVISHGSGGAIHGVPVLKAPHRPMLTVPPTDESTTRRDIDLHAAQLPADQIVTWFGRSVTSVARTVVDIARNLGTTAGVVAIDAALHEHAVTHRELADVIAAQEGWPYVRRARRALELADGGSESVLETLVRICVVVRGLPRPLLQQWIETARGAYRVDQLWPAERVIVEADGLLKYRAGWDEVLAEKLRQEALEQAGYIVVRVTWDEVTRDPDAVARRIRAALERGRRAFRPV